MLCWFLMNEDKEGLVFNKRETEVVVFVDTGDVNSRLADLEREGSTNQQHPSIATHMLVLMLAISIC